MNREGFDDFYAEYSPEYVLSLIDNGENLWYPLINPSQYKRALEEFVKYGQFIQFPTDLIYEWMEIILKNTVIIDRITEFSGHTSFLPVEAVRDYFGMDDDAWEQYRQKLIAEESLLPSELFGDEGVTENVEVSWQQLADAEAGDIFNEQDEIQNGSFTRVTVVYTNDYVCIVLEENVKVVDGNKIVDMENVCPTIVPYEFR